MRCQYCEAIYVAGYDWLQFSDPPHTEDLIQPIVAILGLLLLFYDSSSCIRPHVTEVLITPENKSTVMQNQAPPLKQLMQFWIMLEAQKQSQKLREEMERKVRTCPKCGHESFNPFMVKDCVACKAKPGRKHKHRKSCVGCHPQAPFFGGN